MDRFDYEHYISSYNLEEKFNMDDFRFNLMFTKSFRDSPKCTTHLKSLLFHHFNNKSYFEICYNRCTSYQNFMIRMQQSESMLSKFHTFHLSR